MNAQHTQGRLNYGYRGKEHDGHGARYCNIFTAPTIESMKRVNLACRVLEPDARRLAACWNACEGLTTDALEKLPVPFGELLVGDYCKSERALLKANEEFAAAIVLLRETLALDDEVLADMTVLGIADNLPANAVELTERIRAFLKGVVA